MAGTTPTYPSPLTDGNIFYNGFTEAAKDYRPQHTAQATARMDYDLHTWVGEPNGVERALYDAPGRSRKQLVALSMALGRRVDTVIKNDETSSNAIITSLSALNQTLSTISQQLAGIEKIASNLQELKAAASKGSNSGSGAAPPVARPVTQESIKFAMISRLLQHIASYDESNMETATPGKLYADMALDGSFDAEGGVTFTQLVGMAKDKGLILEVTSSGGARYLKLRL